MDNRGFYTLQPQPQAYELSNQSRGYESQTQQRVTTSSTVQQQRQQQYGYNNVPDIRVQLDSSQLQYSAGTNGSAGVTAGGNSSREQFENRQFELQTSGGATLTANRQLQTLTVPKLDKVDGGHGEVVSVCATSNCDITEHMSEDQYRAWLTSNFKHRFEPYELAGGMPVKEFIDMSKVVSFNRSRNLQQLFTKLDKDGNNRVSWDEFFSGMKYTKKTEVSTHKRAFNSFVESMTTAAQKKIKKEKQEAADAGEPIPEETYLEAYNCRPPPLFIPIFYVACWIFFIVYALQLRDAPEWNRLGWNKGFPYYSPLVFCPSLRQEAWRFLSYMFLHDGYHHIVFNTILSIFLGIPLEVVHKAWRVGPVFIIGVVIGAMASSIVDHATMLIGASGGVYSLFGAHYALIVMNWEELQMDWLDIRGNPLRFLTSGIMRLVYITLLLVLDFSIAFHGRYSGTETLPLSVSAHIGGLLAGFFAGVPILRNIDKKPWEGILSIVCIVVLCLLFLFGVFWNIFYKGYPGTSDIICSNPDMATAYG